MKQVAILIGILAALTANATTTNNDDSCDIGLYPAATLLLPYFEVETAYHGGVDTLFTVTNTGVLPQIARVTVWTDWSYPVLTFNLFLTGYDVQSISMYDVVVNGVIAPTNRNLTAGGTTKTTTPGSFSAPNDGNPWLDTRNCGDGLLPGILTYPLLQALQTALVRGLYSFSQSGCGATPVGSPSSTHRTATTAVGYVTVDVVSRCEITSPNDLTYYTQDLLYDNVLTGDYSNPSESPGPHAVGGVDSTDPHPRGARGWAGGIRAPRQQQRDTAAGDLLRSLSR